jgi:hypothetical protein
MSSIPDLVINIYQRTTTTFLKTKFTLFTVRSKNYGNGKRTEGLKLETRTSVPLCCNENDKLSSLYRNRNSRLRRKISHCSLFPDVEQIQDMRLGFGVDAPVDYKGGEAVEDHCLCFLKHKINVQHLPKGTSDARKAQSPRGFATVASLWDCHDADSHNFNNGSLC